MNIKNVAIFGGNGTIGSLMCGLIAGMGNAKVYLISRNKDNLDDKLLDKIYNSIKSDSIKEKIIKCDYNDAKNVLNKCDWIFESVFEDYEIKKSVYKIIDEFANEKAIISTGTSGLSINELSNALSKKRKKYFLGTHFFNPPYHMTLCEIIPNKYTDRDLIYDFKNYLQYKLLRTTIISKDKPAFVANRIGFKVMNDLIILADLYKEKGGIDYIDSLFTGYTGRNMKPIVTIDFVGLDIHKAIVDNIYNYTDDEFKNSFILPNWFNEHIKNGNIGKKANQGLYKKEEQQLVWNINNNSYIEKKEYKWKEIEEIENLISEGEYVKAYKNLLNCETIEKEIVVKVLIEYIVYSLYISKYTSREIEDCDDAMATGFGWCPPIALKDLIDEVGDFKKLCTQYIGNDIMNKYELYSLIDKLPKSKYDYKKYIKAV